jgi:putative transposase
MLTVVPDLPAAAASDGPFATVRHRIKITRGQGSKAAGLAKEVKLIESAQPRGRPVNAPHMDALVRAGATFAERKLAERPDDPELTAAAVTAAV